MDSIYLDSAFHQSKKQLRIFFHPLDATGHQQASLGLARLLSARGHKIYFLTNQFFKGKFAKFGFEEILLSHRRQTAASAAVQSLDPVLGYAQQLLISGRIGCKSSLEKMKATAEVNQSSNDVFQSMFDACLDYDPQIELAIKREQPDLFVLDHFFNPPAAGKAAINGHKLPLVSIASANPIALFNSPLLPPAHSGYPTDSDPASWTEFNQVLQKQKDRKGKMQQKLNELCNLNETLPVQANLTLYAYPFELDYTAPNIPAPPNCFRMNTFHPHHQSPEPTFELPAELGYKAGERLIYVSLGSMGSIDVQLMKRIIAVLGKTPHKCIVSKGPRAAEYTLPPNCWGEPFLRQTAILPLVDLVITHGGNNTITETFSLGKPTIVIPLFADQYCNAQRVSEKRFGVRLETSFTEAEMLAAIEQLLDDTELHQRLYKAAERIANSTAQEEACNQIEALANAGQTVATTQNLRQTLNGPQCQSFQLSAVC